MFNLRILSAVAFSVALLHANAIKTQILRPGQGDPVQAGQLIQVHYTGWLTDSTQFDSSRDRGEPLEFALGAGQVIPGWDQGLVGMQVGEVRRLVVPPELAYGDRAVGPIPSHSSLVFEVELLNAQKGLEPDSLPTNLKVLNWKTLMAGLEVLDENVGEGPVAKAGERLTLHYTGWLSQGRKFGSSKDLGKPIEGVLGTGTFIKGWELGLEGIKVGGVRWLRVGPSLAYGPAALARIPPNSTLIFRIEALQIASDAQAAERMDFFPNLANTPWQDGPEGLKYSIVQPGEGQPAAVGTKAVVHYTGWLTDGTKFDSSRDRNQPFEFPLGAGRVVRGCDLGVEGMLPGEKRLLMVPPGLGYGSRGGGPIPPDATLIFAVEYLGS